MGLLDWLKESPKPAEKKVEKTEETVTETVKKAAGKVLGTVKRTPGKFCYVTKDGKVMECDVKRGKKKS